MGKKTITFVETALVAAFIGVLVTGMMLHLRHEGIITTRMPMLKTIHYYLGFLMVSTAAIHGCVKAKYLKGLRVKYSLFVYDTYIVGALVLAVFVTGLAILCAHAHAVAGWHYWLGVIMSLFVLYHLYIGLPFLLRTLFSKHTKSH